MSKEEKMMPAIPPDDFGGSVADWLVKLQQRGLWDGHGWHGDILISEDDWWSILEECENGLEEENEFEEEEDDKEEEWDDMDDDPDEEEGNLSIED